MEKNQLVQNIFTMSTKHWHEQAQYIYLLENNSEDYWIAWGDYQ